MNDFDIQLSNTLYLEISRAATDQVQFALRERFPNGGKTLVATQRIDLKDVQFLLEHQSLPRS